MPHISLSVFQLIFFFFFLIKTSLGCCQPLSSNKDHFRQVLLVSVEEQALRVPYSAISKNSMSIFKRSLEIMREKLSKMKSRYEEISVEGNKEMGNTREDSMWGTGEIKTSTVYAN